MNNDFTWVMFALIVAGILSFTGAIFAGLTMVEYEFTHEQTVTEHSEIEDGIGAYQSFNFTELSDGEQAIVEKTITDGSIVVDDGNNSAHHLRTQSVVNKGNDHYVIKRSAVLDWDSTGGVAAVVLALSGVLFFAIAVRRQFS